MASIADTIFGPTPEELEYKRRQEQEQQARQEYLAKLPSYGSQFGRYAGVARAGLETGEKLRGTRLFGESPSPEMERATVMKQILDKYKGQDMSSPEVLAQMSGELGQMGYPREAMQLMEQAKAGVASAQEARRKAEVDALSLEKTRLEIEKARKEIGEVGKGDPLTDKAIGEFRDIANEVNDFKRLNSTAKPSYFQLSRPVLDAAKLGLGTANAKEAQLWWADYDKFLSMVRNKLYGSALTESEIKNFQKAIVTELTDPDQAMKMLRTQQELAIKGYRKLQELYKAQGKNTAGLDALIGEVEGMGGGSSATSGEWSVEVEQ
jgi:hypothetical protein